MFTIRLHLSDKLYVRDPQQTELGRRIVDAGIKLIDELGFEKFTFKKLADAIASTEASIYRYFDNKHRFLIYLVSWYWSWIDYRIAFHTHNLAEPLDKLHKVVEVLSESTSYDPSFAHVDEVALHRIVVVESSKVYQTKWVDDDNKEGLFAGYKGLCGRIAEIICTVDDTYPYPRALASTIIEASHQQIFFAEHLPSLTEVEVEPGEYRNIAKFLEDLLERALGAAAVSG